jgi:hypothetical protein
VRQPGSAHQPSLLETKMNTRQWLAAIIVFAAAGGVLAEEQKEYVDFVNVPSTRTRAEVRAELEQAYRDGLLWQNTEIAAQPQITYGKSRADIRREMIQSARRDRTDSIYFGS